MFKLSNFKLNSKALPGLLLVAALVGFEIFNFDTTRFALSSFYPSEVFFGISWAMLLALAACLMDFAGLVRIFTPQKGKEEPLGVWLVIGGWLLAAVLNALLTWYGTVLALEANPYLGTETISRATLLDIVPAGIALMVWLIRVSLIGALSTAGESLSGVGKPKMAPMRRPEPVREPVRGPSLSMPVRPINGMNGNE